MPYVLFLSNFSSIHPSLHPSYITIFNSNSTIWDFIPLFSLFIYVLPFFNSWKPCFILRGVYLISHCHCHQWCPIPDVHVPGSARLQYPWVAPLHRRPSHMAQTSFPVLGHPAQRSSSLCVVMTWAELPSFQDELLIMLGLWHLMLGHPCLDPLFTPLKLWYFVLKKPS